MTRASLLDGFISLRPECADDAAFLLELYASTREDELKLTGWGVATREAFVKMQFNNMRQGYAAMFPKAQFDVILLEQKPAGRLVVHRADDEIRIVDIALLPAFRNRGIGTFLLQKLFSEAERENKPLRLHVLKSSRAAHFYERLVFGSVGEEGPYLKMEWRSKNQK
jgi:ribosomal protein S18 acetylase RimI-like enzyme